MSRSHRLTTHKEAMLAAGSPFYVKIRVDEAAVHGVQIQWHDTTSAFTVTPYTTLLDDPTVPADGAAGPTLEEWHDESADVSITGGVGAAVGCDVVHLGNIGAKWLLLKLTVTANSLVTITKMQKD